MMAAFFTSIPAMIVLTGLLVGASAALLGTFLVLRGNTMLTDAISHSIVLGIVVVWLLTRDLGGPAHLIGAALTGVLTVLLTEALARSRLVKLDAAIGLVFPALFATGVILISVHARDVHIDVQSILLGEIGFVWLHTVPVAGQEVPLSVLTLSVVLLANLVFVLAFWKELKLASFDPGLAATLGLLPAALHYGLLTLTSVTAVAAFDAVGVILFIAFVTVPPATAYLLTRHLWQMIVVALLVASLSCGLGYALAVRWDLSIAGMMASMTGLCFVTALLCAPGRGVVARALQASARRRDLDCTALIAHLFTHEGTPAMPEENTTAALISHLGWREERARAAILRALDRALIERKDGMLALRPKGRAEAEAIFGRPGL